MMLGIIVVKYDSSSVPNCVKCSLVMLGEIAKFPSGLTRYTGQSKTFLVPLLRL